MLLWYFHKIHISTFFITLPYPQHALKILHIKRYMKNDNSEQTLYHLLSSAPLWWYICNPCCEIGVRQDVCVQPANTAQSHQAECDIGWLNPALLPYTNFTTRITNITSHLWLPLLSSKPQLELTLSVCPMKNRWYPLETCMATITAWHG